MTPAVRPVITNSYRFGLYSGIWRKKVLENIMNGNDSQRASIQLIPSQFRAFLLNSEKFSYSKIVP